MSSGSSGGGAAGLSSERERRALLQTIVEMTRAVFEARACSIMSHDPTARELVFEAVAGEGADTLIGRRIPSNRGAAGWCLASEEPIAIGDVKQDPRFARDIAESTGFVPTKLTVYPLLHDERSLGVLSVLDQGISPHVGLAEMQVLSRIATHAAAVLALVLASRGADGVGALTGPLGVLHQSLLSAPAGQREASLALLDALTRLLEDG